MDDLQYALRLSGGVRLAGRVHVEVGAAEVGEDVKQKRKLAMSGGARTSPLADSDIMRQSEAKGVGRTCARSNTYVM